MAGIRGENNLSGNNVASGNRINVSSSWAQALVTPFIIFSVFFVVLLAGSIGYLILKHSDLVSWAILGGFGLLSLMGVFWCVTWGVVRFEWMRAQASHYRAQKFRNAVVETGESHVTLYDPDRCYRLENAKEVHQTFHYDARGRRDDVNVEIEEDFGWPFRYRDEQESFRRLSWLVRTKDLRISRSGKFS